MKTNQVYKIIDAVPASIYWKNVQGIYQGCNQYMLEMAGLKQVSEIIGKTDAQLPWKDIADELFKTDQRVIQEKLVIETEETPILANQEKKIFLTTKTPLMDETNDVVGVIGVSVDITERKKMEEKLDEARKMAESSDRAKTEFLQNMRHDLRTPFTGILGLSDFMESQETDPIKKENLGYIAQSAKALLDQLNEIFEFVQVESGQLPILEKTFNLHELINDVTSMMLLPAKNKNLDFTLTIEKEVPEYLVGDRVRTQRILMNLIANAIKFTDKGHVKIKVSVANQLDTSVILNFRIEDTGIGIPDDKRDIIFERFNRLTSSYSGVYPGKGLGLRIVKQFLDEIGGQPDLETAVDRGTTFRVIIPYKLPLISDQIKNEML